MIPVYLLSSYLISPRVGYVEQAMHCFAYLKKYNRPKILFDDTYPPFDAYSFFKLGTWEVFYSEASEQIPNNSPSARGSSATSSFFVVIDHT